MSETSASGVAIIIPAKNEQDRIGATIQAAAGLLAEPLASGEAGRQPAEPLASGEAGRQPVADLVIVVDDGSTDRTAGVAADAGATVVGHPRNRGKAAAMETGATAVAAIESREKDRPGPRALLFVDADLEDSAARVRPLIEPVLTGAADMTIAVLPAQRGPGGGRGLVVDLARNGVERGTGWAPRQPLSGQRCLTRAAFDAALPLAPGWGVEVGLTIDLLRQGYRVLEVDVDLHHRVTGTDWTAQLHRAKQYAGVLRALATRGIRPSVPERLRRTGG